MRNALLFLFLILPVASTARTPLPHWLHLEGGVKGYGAGNIWVEPDNCPPTIGFTETTAGWAAGVGPFVEARFFKYAALDIELLFAWDRMIEKDTIGWRKVKFTAKMFDLKIPILLKGVLPFPGVKLSLGTGPVIEYPLSVKMATNPDVISLMDAEEAFSVLWAINLGIDIKLYRGLRLPIDIRASYNISQPAEYKDRVTLSLNGNSVTRITIKYQNTWELGMLMGLAWEF